jgi:hypothetical protein
MWKLSVKERLNSEWRFWSPNGIVLDEEVSIRMIVVMSFAEISKSLIICLK